MKSKGDRYAGRSPMSRVAANPSGCSVWFGWLFAFEFKKSILDVLIMLDLFDHANRPSPFKIPLK
jgi:hypothetical protein